MPVVADGGCSYTGPIVCNTPIDAYTCNATIDYQAVDDGGGDASGITYYLTPGAYTTVLTMTGGAPTGSTGPGQPWQSTSPGTATLCYFGPNSVAPGCVIANIGTSPIGTCSVPIGWPRNSTYWETCTPFTGVLCGTNPPFNPVYYRRSLWLAGPCCTSCPARFIPKTICMTFDGPSEIFGSDAGAQIMLYWDPTSWDGSCETVMPGGFEVNGVPMVWKSDCRSPNGAGGYCYTEPEGDGAVITGDFVPYGSAMASLSILPTYSGCYATGTYQNFWNGGCPNPDNPPSCGTIPVYDPETGGTIFVPYYPQPPYYCGALAYRDAYFWYNAYPMNAVFLNMYDPPGDIAGMGAQVCSPLNLVNTMRPGDYPESYCPAITFANIDIGPWTTSAVVNDCGEYYGGMGVMMARRGDSGGLVVRGYANSGTGYGRMTARLMEQLSKRGIPTSFESVVPKIGRDY